MGIWVLCLDTLLINGNEATGGYEGDLSCLEMQRRLGADVVSFSQYCCHCVSMVLIMNLRRPVLGHIYCHRMVYTPILYTFVPLSDL